MTAHVFLGPTLPAAEAAKHLDATFHPPVAPGWQHLRVAPGFARTRPNIR